MCRMSCLWPVECTKTTLVVRWGLVIGAGVNVTAGLVGSTGLNAPVLGQ